MDEKKPRINANEHERKHWDLCHDIVEVFFAVYNELGFGFLEGVYEEALSVALVEPDLQLLGKYKLQFGFAEGRSVSIKLI